MNVLRLRNLLAVLALAGVLLAIQVPTASGQGGTSIQISPPNFEILADPGQVVAQTMRVTNRGGSPLPVTMQVSGFSPTGQEGQAVLSDEEAGEFSIVAWTTVTPKEFLLQPAGVQDVTFIIAILENAPPGGQYASILASIGGGTTAQGLSVGQRIGALVLLRVAGDVIERAELVQLDAPSMVSKGPIDVSALIENSGNVHVRAAGFIVVKGTFGGEIIKFPLAQENVLPDSQRLFKGT